MFTKDVVQRIKFIAEQNRWDPRALLALVDVESDGKALWDVEDRDDPLPPIRFEYHYFHDRLNGDDLQEAKEQGLAYPEPGMGDVPKTYGGRYNQLARAMKIDTQAAFDSTSMGLGQVMGAWWEELNYDSPSAMFQRARSGIAGQVELMVRFLKWQELGRHLKPDQIDFLQIAEGYNGRNDAPAYAKRLKKAYSRWKDKSLSYESINEDKEMEAHKQLERLGHKNVEQFQDARGLTVDGIIGPMTRQELKQAIAEQDSDKGDRAVKRGVGALVPATAAELGQDLLEKVQFLSSMGMTSIVLDVLVGVLSLAGVGLLLYGVYKKFTSTR